MKKYLIEVDELKEKLNDAEIVIVDCRFDLADPAWGRKDYFQSHIPGAVYADLNYDLSAPITQNSGRHPLPMQENFQAFMSKIGVDASKTVIAYDTSAGSIAARLWWLLRAYGHEKTFVLNGGFAAWQQHEYPFEKGEIINQPAIFEGIFQNHLLVTSADVETYINNDEYLILDARAHNRFAGIEEPIDAIAGHISSAINIFHQNNLTNDGRFLPAEDLELLYQFTNSVSNVANIILYCGSGVTSCVNLLALAQIGKESARLYAGSWSEWIRDPSHLKMSKLQK